MTRKRWKRFSECCKFNMFCGDAC